jgi:hypothetical protein
MVTRKVSRSQANSFAGELSGIQQGEDRLEAAAKVIETMKAMGASEVMIREAQRKLAAAQMAREITNG